MNNQEFRRLVLDTPARQPTGILDSVAASRDGGASLTLGSRQRSSIPMTPRSVTGSSRLDFRHQLASLAPASTKKFRSSAAPKGAKLPAGYHDRAQARKTQDGSDADDKAARMQALEEMMKLGQIAEDTYTKLRDEIVGGDVGTTHLVKGLDWRLLERVRRGEDVIGGLVRHGNDTKDETEKETLDEELDRLQAADVKPIPKENKSKAGQMAPPLAPSTGKKRTRDEILAELKASRQAAKEKSAASQLGPRFKRFGEDKGKGKASRTEINERGREVLIIVDEDGRVKRKVRRVSTTEISDGASKLGLLVPEKDAKPLGMEILELPKPPAQEEDARDIFDDAGLDYNPLAGLSGDEDASSSQSGEERTPNQTTTSERFISGKPLPASDSAKESPTLLPPSGPRNYFSTPSAASEPSVALSANPINDPSLLAALKKASTLIKKDEGPPESLHSSKPSRRAAMLSSHDRDADDVDLGFGSSRFADDEDAEDSSKRVKLSIWGGKHDKGDGKDGGKEKRKRGPKRRKGDKNSAADVLQAIERRKNV